MKATTRDNLTVPNFLSGLRLASVPVFVWLFVSGRENLAVALYAAGAFTDFLDGYIARRTDQVTELGKVLDPVADRALIVALVIALIARGVLPVALAAAILVRDALVVAVFPLLERRGMARIPVNFAGKSATAALLIGLTWLAWSQTTFVGASAGRNIGLPFVVVGATLYWVAAMMYATEARRRLKGSGEEAT